MKLCNGGWQAVHLKPYRRWVFKLHKGRIIFLPESKGYISSASRQWRTTLVATGRRNCKQGHSIWPQYCGDHFVTLGHVKETTSEMHVCWVEIEVWTHDLINFVTKWNKSVLFHDNLAFFKIAILTVWMIVNDENRKLNSHFTWPLSIFFSLPLIHTAKVKFFPNQVLSCWRLSHGPK